MRYGEHATARQGTMTDNYLWHRPGSIKGRIHREYDERGLDAALALGARMRRQTGGETPKENTIRQWVSFWKNHPGFRSGEELRASRAQSGKKPIGELAEDAMSFRDQQVRRSMYLGPKASATVMVDQALLAESKSMSLNLSDLLEAELRKRVTDERGRRWAEENRGFIDSYNAYIERNGVFGEDLLDLDDPPV